MSPIKHHATGIEYWRSLEQLADTPEVREALGKEFAGYDSDTILSSTRRGFLKLMAASMALAGVTLTGCRRWPKEQLAPYSSNPRDRMPGVPEQYATAWELSGVASGLLVTSYDGRPIKIEGNPTHPSSVVVKDKYGSADAFAQASILELYDPERSRTVVDRTGAHDRRTTWDDFVAATGKHFAGLKGSGSGFAILSEPTSSPSVADLRKRLVAAFPQARWYEYEALSRDAELEGSRLAFEKKALRPVLHLDQADVVVCLDADLLGGHPAHTRYAADWAAKRRSADSDKPEMSRVFVAESGFTITGSVADMRIGTSPDRIYAIARALAAKLKVAGVTDDAKLNATESRFVEQAAADLANAGPAGVVAVGPAASAAAHALAHAINEIIGAAGKTVTYIEDSAGDRLTHMQAIAELSAALSAGAVTTLLILGGNPVYDAPADVNFPAALAKTPLSIHLSLYDNETSKACKWHVPRAHYLESWGDARSWDGAAGIVQPLIEPLYGGKSVIEVLAAVNGDEKSAGYDIVRRTWSGQLGVSETSADFDKPFRKVVEAGVLAGTESKPVNAKVKLADLPAIEAVPATNFTLRFDVDSHVYDGRFANNGWLQETPDPLSKLLWDNAALFSKTDADKLGVEPDDLVKIDTPDGRSLTLAAYVLPGQPVGVVTIPLGYGRGDDAGHIGANLGFNAYTIRTSKAPWAVPGVKITKTGGTYALIGTQDHHAIDANARGAIEARVGEKYESGKIIREASLVEYKENPAAVVGGRKVKLQLFENPTHYRDVHAWGMSIDMSACIGCNACAVACQSENNIPVVGKEECFKHREMNWIRIDRYFKGDAEDPNPEVVFQPMMCQHCENAPCEQVCPVAATMHDSEGLNVMVYNRCIGTRYCSNNCPYKVRRFNYFDFHAQDPRFGLAWLKKPWPNMPDLQQREQVDKIKAMVFNPEVTVRMRGVMEKCTYCVQRIHTTVIGKRNNGSDVADGDILTACQQACPTQAIVFGNLNDKESQVSKLHESPRAYSVLDEELNTKPRTRYLAKLRNPVEESNHEEKKA
ncbi:MAG: molybdenum binding protein [Phycisphaerales bacterium]|nr:molybdenum binding protein [Phycisphaerales bacterium]